MKLSADYVIFEIFLRRKYYHGLSLSRHANYQRRSIDFRYTALVDEKGVDKSESKEKKPTRCCVLFQGGRNKTEKRNRH